MMFKEAPPTEKQLNFINALEEYGAPPFTGATKQEASIHISKYKHFVDEAADDVRFDDPWAITHGYD
ncbi:MAG: hypothetical protein J6M62_11305 [Selenomonadaceae bacterium]|nr:hypothetical protein [Selenomonadaceae bacterium]MBO6305641.1 hypothetical protein [Selenomonadaceae bacterium]